MRFRKIPVEVEAVRFDATEEGIDILKRFCGAALGRVIRSDPESAAEAEICTLEDGLRMVVRHVATEGDWVIKGEAGDFYPCKPDIFEKTYEQVDETRVRNYCRGAPRCSPELDRYLRSFGL